MPEDNVPQPLSEEELAALREDVISAVEIGTPIDPSRVLRLFSNLTDAQDESDLFCTALVRYAKKCGIPEGDELLRETVRRAMLSEIIDLQK